jgi:hypothetical protein
VVGDHCETNDSFFIIPFFISKVCRN